jgi:hypothetical protein
MFEPQPSPQRKRDSCGCLDGGDVAELGCDAIGCAPDCSLLAEHGAWRGAALIRRRLRLCQLTGRARRRA